MADQALSDDGAMSDSMPASTAHFIDVGDSFSRWQAIGEKHGLQSNRDIARFLIRCYNDIWEGKSSPSCYHCHVPLKFTCRQCGWADGDAKLNADLEDEDHGSTSLDSTSRNFSSKRDEADKTPATDDDSSAALDGGDVGTSSEGGNQLISDLAALVASFDKPEDDSEPKRPVQSQGTPDFAASSAWQGKGGKGRYHPYRNPVSMVPQPAVPLPLEDSEGLPSEKKVEKTLGNIVAKLAGKAVQKATVERGTVGMMGHKGMMGTKATTGIMGNKIAASMVGRRTTMGAGSKPADSVKQMVAGSGVLTSSSQAVRPSVPQTQPATTSTTTTTSKKQYSCPQCGQEFTHVGHLNVHIRSHTGEKPHQCQQCSATFVNNSGLKKHMRIHTGDKPFQCDLCDARFMYSGQLTIHYRTHTGERPFKCTFCDASFTKSTALNQHLKNHTGDKNHVCPICSARFTKNTYLTAHLRTHSGERPFKCNQCNASFTDDGSLLAHMKKHSGQRPYVCQECGRTFAHSSNLRQHIMTTHNDNSAFVRNDKNMPTYLVNRDVIGQNDTVFPSMLLPQTAFDGKNTNSARNGASQNQSVFPTSRRPATDEEEEEEGEDEEEDYGDESTPEGDESNEAQAVAMDSQ